MQLYVIVMSPAIDLSVRLWTKWVWVRIQLLSFLNVSECFDSLPVWPRTARVIWYLDFLYDSLIYGPLMAYLSELMRPVKVNQFVYESQSVLM